MPREPAQQLPQLAHYIGDYHGVLWNAQGYFMARAAAQTRKRRQAARLLARRDFLLLTEAHSTVGGARAYVDLPGTRSWWASGTAARAGVGIIVKESFLQRFGLAIPQWHILEIGRLAVLKLVGPQGALDILVGYYPTGTRETLHDPSLPEPLEEAVSLSSLRAQRGALTDKVREYLKQSSALILFGADFNFVVHDRDRWNHSIGCFVGSRDAVEARGWEVALPQDRLYELYQPSHTHSGPFSTSRIDRVYTNQHLSNQLDRTVFAAVLEDTGLSQHRPVAFGRWARLPREDRNRPISEDIVQDERWPLRVAMEFLDLQNTLPVSANPVVRLRRLKVAMRAAAEQLRIDRADQTSNAPTPLLDVTMSALRRLERAGLQELPALLAHHPGLCDALPPHVSQLPLEACLGLLRDLAIVLAKKAASTALQEFHDGRHLLGDEHKNRRKEQILRQLKKLAPGATAQLAATVDQDGTVVTDGPGISSALRRHWGPTFAAKRLNRACLDRWLCEDTAADWGLKAAVHPLLADEGAWRIRKADVRRALALAGSSSPGPDGIPYSAWKKLGPLGVDVLFEAANGLMLEGGIESMLEAFPIDACGNSQFNEALMIFIPKKCPQTFQNIEYHEPSDVRPLSVVNTDNRLMANAVRMRIEPLLAQAISPAQRGFLPGRSLIQNVVEIDGEMRVASALGENSAAVFFDFAAAFPSLSHDFLHAVLAHVQLPATIRRFVQALYTGNGCSLIAAGDSYEGFSIRSGIRQGCPLSPLLFALCGDLLVRKLQRSVPQDMLRAYADDLALVSRDIFFSVQAFAPIFQDFVEVSGLALNIRKTVFVPLGDSPPETLRLRIDAIVPGWGSAAFRFYAEYLGFYLGPDAGTRCWDKTLAKVRRRAELWSRLGLGMHFSTLAYNVYVASLLGFLLQLAPLPVEWKSTEISILRRLLPGPGNWVTPSDLHGLKDVLGMPHNVACMEEISLAARFRVAHREAAASGGLRVPQSIRRLDAAYQASVLLLRCGRWRTWFQNSFYHHLQAAVDRCGALGISLADIEHDLGAAEPKPHTRSTARRLEQGVQKAVRARLGRSLRPSGEPRLRRKLARWQLPIFPRVAATRALLVMARLRRLVQPRVIAAVIRTWFNGWCTSRRFQQQGSCIFGCRYGEDAVQHYLQCGVLHGFAAQRLRLVSPVEPQQRRLAALLLLPRNSLDDVALTLRALLVAAAYSLHCKCRRTGALGNEEVVRRALEQAVKEAALGHPSATRCLDTRWIPSRLSDAAV